MQYDRDNVAELADAIAGLTDEQPAEDVIVATLRVAVAVARARNRLEPDALDLVDLIDELKRQWKLEP